MSVLQLAPLAGVKVLRGEPQPLPAILSCQHSFCYSSSWTSLTSMSSFWENAN